MNDAMHPEDRSLNRERWEAYIRRIFQNDPEPGFTPPVPSPSKPSASPLSSAPLPQPAPKPAPEPVATSSRLGIRPGAILAMPLRGEDDSLPAGFYVLLTDPQLPVVTLCIAGRDSEGCLCPTDRRITVRRETLDMFQPVAGLRLY